jgi:UV DNA damage repair endonuclease
MKTLIILNLISNCCNEGYGHLIKLYETLTKNNITCLLCSNNYSDSNRIEKYKITKEQLPVIVVDELNMIFAAKEADKHLEEITKKALELK